jgi:hypothetical protein
MYIIGLDIATKKTGISIYDVELNKISSYAIAGEGYSKERLNYTLDIIRSLLINLDRPIRIFIESPIFEEFDRWECHLMHWDEVEIIKRKYIVDFCREVFNYLKDNFVCPKLIHISLYRHLAGISNINSNHSMKINILNQIKVMSRRGDLPELNKDVSVMSDDEIDSVVLCIAGLRYLSKDYDKDLVRDYLIKEDLIRWGYSICRLKNYSHKSYRPNYTPVSIWSLKDDEGKWIMKL